MSGVWFRISVIGVAILLPQRHEHARHQREVKRHVALVAVAEVVAHVGRPLVRLGEQHPVRGSAASSSRRIRFSTACVSGRFSLLVPSRTQRYGTASSRSASTPRSSQNFITSITASDDRRVVVVEIRLVREEAVPVVLLRHRVERPVRLLGVGEDDARLRKLRVGVAPDVEVALGRARRRVPRRAGTTDAGRRCG